MKKRGVLRVQRVQIAAMLGVLLSLVAVVLRVVGMAEAWRVVERHRIDDLTDERHVMETMMALLTLLRTAGVHLAQGNMLLLAGGFSSPMRWVQAVVGSGGSFGLLSFSVCFSSGSLLWAPFLEFGGRVCCFSTGRNFLRGGAFLFRNDLMAGVGLPPMLE